MSSSVFVCVLGTMHMYLYYNSVEPYNYQLIVNCAHPIPNMIYCTSYTVRRFSFLIVAFKGEGVAHPHLPLFSQQTSFSTYRKINFGAPPPPFSEKQGEIFHGN